jgi:uncharacterized protein with PIN domain
VRLSKGGTNGVISLQVSLLQQRLVTKEKEVDTLKLAMASTARAVQSKVHASEAALALQRLECGDLKDEVDSLRSTSGHLQVELSTTRAHLAEALARAMDIEQQVLFHNVHDIIHEFLIVSGCSHPKHL